MNPTAPAGKRVLSGVQPSGKLHLGNYFGAIRQHIALQDEATCFYFIADYHALTTIEEATRRRVGNDEVTPADRAATLRENVRDVALDYLALGLDPDKAADILIYRSHVVPVGQDQVQHIDMTRDIAEKFNRTYGEVFPVPNYRLDRGAKVPGTDGQKMSKS